MNGSDGIMKISEEDILLIFCGLLYNYNNRFFGLTRARICKRVFANGIYATCVLLH